MPGKVRFLEPITSVDVITPGIFTTPGIVTSSILDIVTMTETTTADNNYATINTICARKSDVSVTNYVSGYDNPRMKTIPGIVTSSILDIVTTTEITTADTTIK